LPGRSEKDGIVRYLPKFVVEAAPIAMLAGAGVLALRAGKARQGHAAPLERDRGRTAHTPWQIPLKGWKDILIRTFKEINEDQVTLMAAGVSFYTLLAVFPGIAAFVALYGLFADVATAERQLEALAVVLPADTLKFLGDQMIRLAAAQKGGLSVTFALGLLTSIWSANGAVNALITGLNVAYEERETRGRLRRTLTSLAFTLGLLVYGLAAILVLSAGPALNAYVGSQAAFMLNLISWPILLIGMGVGLALLYHYGPSRNPARFQWLSVGSGVALLVWIGVSALFSLYVGNFAHYDKTYGSLGAVVGFMMWNWLTNVVVLAGAELNSEMEAQTAVDTTEGAPRPMGRRGAEVADKLGPAQAVSRALSLIPAWPGGLHVR
jgi:membrane protein